MKIVPLMLLLMAGTILVSCQKEISSETKTEELQSERLLTKITYTGDDSRFIDSFEYDVQDRCTRYVSIYYDLSIPNPQPYIYFYEFYYNGNETLPYKIADTSQGRGMTWLVGYDAQKRKTVDSMLYFSSDEKQVSRYTYSSNRVIAVSLYTSPSYTSLNKDTFDFDGNNVTRYSVAMDDGSAIYTWQNTMTYDTRINPVSKMNIATAVLFGAFGTLGTPNGLNKNNVLSETYSSNGQPPSTASYQYVYDADNFPVSGTYTNGTVQGTIIYNYKK
jgi:hypothetical protein